MESSTSNNPWPSRMVRIGTFVVLIVIFFGLGRFFTYQVMLSDGNVTCERTYTSAIVSEATGVDAVLDSQRPDDPISWLLYDGNEASYYGLGDGTGKLLESKLNCGWLDDFGAGFGDYALGHFTSVLVMFFTAIALMLAYLFVFGAAAFARYLWRGPLVFTNDESTSPVDGECHDPSCRCGYHHGASVFDREDEVWFVECHDRSCTCLEHADETFDETKNAWV